MFILSRADLGVLIKQQMRRRKELVKFSTTVIFYLPPTIPNKKSLFLLPVSLHNKSFSRAVYSSVLLKHLPSLSSAVSHRLPSGSSREHLSPCSLSLQANQFFPTPLVDLCSLPGFLVGLARLELKKPFPLGEGEGLSWVWSQGC